MTELTHPADQEALSRILRVKPVWTQMRSAADAIDLAENRRKFGKILKELNIEAPELDFYFLI